MFVNTFDEVGVCVCEHFSMTFLHNVLFIGNFQTEKLKFFPPVLYNSV